MLSSLLPPGSGDTTSSKAEQDLLTILSQELYDFAAADITAHPNGQSFDINQAHQILLPVLFQNPDKIEFNGRLYLLSK